MKNLKRIVYTTFHKMENFTSDQKSKVLEVANSVYEGAITFILEGDEIISYREKRLLDSSALKFSNEFSGIKFAVQYMVK